jgi:hypothetical protein
MAMASPVSRCHERLASSADSGCTRGVLCAGVLRGAAQLMVMDFAALSETWWKVTSCGFPTILVKPCRESMGASDRDGVFPRR